MKSSQIRLTPEQKLELKDLSLQNASSWQIMKRLEAIRLLDSGLVVTAVAKQLCVKPEVIYKCIKTYTKEGIYSLVTLDKPGRESKLSEDQLQELEKYIAYCKAQKIRCTSSDQVIWIKEKCNVDIGQKWLYKKLLVRRHAHLDKILSFTGGVTLIGNYVISTPGIRRTFFLSFTYSQLFINIASNKF